MANIVLPDSDERILWQHRPAWREFILWLVLGTLLLAALGFGLIVFLCVTVARFRYFYLITEDRVACRVGFLCHDISEVDILDLRDISLHQTLWQRILRTGDIGFSSAGQAGVEVIFRGVSHPEQVKEIVRQRKREMQHELLREYGLVAQERNE